MEKSSSNFFWTLTAAIVAILIFTIFVVLRSTPSPGPKSGLTIQAPAMVQYGMHLPKIKADAGMPAHISSIDKIAIPSICITATVQDLQGRWWFGTEGRGVYCYSPGVNGHGHWQHFTRWNAAPNNAYALACDAMGRIWAGSLRHGVCVYNGQHWRDYDLIAGLGFSNPHIRSTVTAPLTVAKISPVISAGDLSGAGPLGQRVFAIATSPVDGSVWIATSKGLSRYRLHYNIWQYYTSADGLPSDALSCLAFAPDGTLFVGTQYKGIAYATHQNHYQSWKRVAGPLHLPLVGSGAGIASNLINALLVVPREKVAGQWRYRVYAGTDGGLAIGRHDGRDWHFIRGRNYIHKIKGLWHIPAIYPHPSAAAMNRLVTSDVVTCLAEDTDGNIWIGHRSTGFEVWNQQGDRLFPTAHSIGTPNPHGYFASMAPLGDGGMLLGGYQCGAFHASEQWSGIHQEYVPWQQTTAPPLPAGACPPSAVMLNQWIARVTADQGNAVNTAFMGEDWRTEGDWLGHYGVCYARLCLGTPNFFNAEEQFWGGLGVADITRESSPHQGQGDVAYFVALYHSTLLRTLYYPDMNQRIEGEWNDAGGRYPRLFDGPDMWLKVKIPQGLYRLSFYFHNKDNQTGENDIRDFVVQIYPKNSSPTKAWAHQRPLAQGRVMQFWGGMYTSFLLKGPGAYQVRLKRNYGFWMTVAGMFLDRLSGPKNFTGYTNLDGLPMRNYRPATFHPTPAVSASPAWRLWQLLNSRSAYSNVDMRLQWPGRLLAYRYAQSHDFPAALLARWRWKLCIWQPEDRQTFNQAIAQVPSGARPLNQLIGGVDTTGNMMVASGQ